MADAVSKKEKSFLCPLCLDLLKDPVAIPCGHNFCMRCINDCWDQEDHKGTYRCPVCKHTFNSRPVLYKNPLIAEMVETFRETRIEDPPLSLCTDGPEDVECDICTGTKLKAVKSCLECLKSYCENHFKLHNDLHPDREHPVVDATGQLKDRICTQHQKVLEIFCRTDHSRICYLCTMDEHKGHDTVTAAIELKDKQRKYHESILERETELQEMEKAVKTLMSSAETAEEDCERIFTEMIDSIDRRRSEVRDLIRAQQKAEASRAEELLQKLEEDIAELKTIDAELEQLSHIEDHIQLLKSVQSITDPPSEDLPSKTLNQNTFFESVTKSVCALKDLLEDKLDAISTQAEAKVSTADIDPKLPLIRRSRSSDKLLPNMSDPYQPVSEEFSQYFRHFKVDPNTVNRRINLTSATGVSFRDCLYSYPNHPDRFGEGLHQALSTEGFSGRCYWEVGWYGLSISIAVSYKSINRKGGNDCKFGQNNQSWCLEIQGNKSTFWHNKKQTVLPVVTTPRIGVYVDHRAGTLAFYSIFDTMKLLHKVETTFTEPLYPGFLLGMWSQARFRTSPP